MIFDKQLTRHQKGILFERMSMLLANSMSSSEVFKALSEEFKIVSAKLDICAGKAKNGESIVSCMNQVHLLTPSEYATLSSGEAAGKLPETLESLSIFTEKIESQISSAKKAILPNVGYVILAATILYFMMLSIVPSIGANIDARKREKFFVFKLSDAVEHFHENYALIFIGVIVVLTFAIAKKLSTNEGKDQLTDFLLKLPSVSKGLLTFNLAMWARQSSMMLKSGVTFNDVIKMTSSSLPRTIRNGVNQILKDVSEFGWQKALNKKMWNENDSRREWPPEVFGALRSGGSTGNLDVSLEKLAVSLEKTSTRLINNTTKLFSFITFAIAASSVAFVIISVIMATMSGIAK